MKKGFTLIELSIVLVVISIVIAGVVAGQSLIQSSKRQKQIKMFQDVNLGAQAFKLEFGSVPGDFDEAYDYWGDDCDSYEVRCNGNGDKVISKANLHFYSQVSQKEKCMFFKHMGLAGIWKDTYTCNAAQRPYDQNNSMKNVFNSDNYFAVTSLCKEGIEIIDCNSPNDYMINRYFMISAAPGFGGAKSQYLNCEFTPGLKSINMKYYDEKLDDGKPKTGKMVAIPIDRTCSYAVLESGDCLKNNTENEYNVSTDDFNCQMRWRMPF
jgi:prepilin-type N-terminal cleavage/methylation domain-containing protein